MSPNRHEPNIRTLSDAGLIDTVASVVLLDRDVASRSVTTAALKAASHKVMLVATPAVALECLQIERPDVILVDPEDAGAGRLREVVAAAVGTGTLVVALSAQASEDARIAAFEAGVDDYLVKPFSVRELVLRVRALVRGRTRRGETIVNLGPLRIDRVAFRVWVNERAINLTKREIDLLLFLADRRGVVSREALLEGVWRHEAIASARAIDTAIRRLRGKLGAARDLLHTVRGTGYQLRVPAPAPRGGVR